MNKQVRVGLLGLGTVGQGVVEILQANAKKISTTLNRDIIIKKIFIRNIDKYKSIVNESLLTTDLNDVVSNDSIDIVVEVMGGVDTAKEAIEKSLQHKKHVVTANKDLMALYGNELLQLAKENGCDLFYEASVGGGIPILRTLIESLMADEITEVSGILNGTTNFMLTQMNEQHVSYDSSLKEAQSLGFAEADPTSDVAGLDAARKMVILCRLAFGTDIDLDSIYTQGIQSISISDILYAEKSNYTIKLISYGKTKNNQLYAEVGPVLVPNTHPLAAIKNENNGILVVGKSLGETFYSGAGAGKLPTAHSVVNDVMQIAKNMALKINGKVFHAYTNDQNLLAFDQVAFPYYYRVQSNTADEFNQLLEQLDIKLVKTEETTHSNTRVVMQVMTSSMSVLKHQQLVDALKRDNRFELQIFMRIMS